MASATSSSFFKIALATLYILLPSCFINFENASLSRTYKIEIYDVNELPPKVSIKVKSAETVKVFSTVGEDQTFEFTISDQLDAILETPY